MSHDPTSDKYLQFLRSKMVQAPETGFPCHESEVTPLLKPHQRKVVVWAVRGGRRAIFLAFGLGKTVIQLEILRLILLKLGNVDARALIVLPLNVRQEFINDAIMLGIPVRFVQTDAEITTGGIYLTNYESVRESKIDVLQFAAVSLDEAAILRGFGGTKTFRKFMSVMAGDEKTVKHRKRTAGVPYRFVATATPSPNEFVELLAYSAFLGIMDVGQAKTRFFKRNSQEAGDLTLYAHKEDEFWLWISTWGIFLQSPADLGLDATGYQLPELEVYWHEVSAEHSDTPDMERWGQAKLFRDTVGGIVDAAREKRDSVKARIAKMMELRAMDPSAHRILWHDLESERKAIEKEIPGVATVFGSQDLDKRETIIADFANGRIPELAGKPVMLGSGCNLQRHCHWAIFLGVGFKFNDFIQAVHRIQRFLQSHTVRIDLIHTDAERDVKTELLDKWNNHKKLVARMTEIIQKYGLANNAMEEQIGRSIGVERVEVIGRNYRLVNNDCVLELANIRDNSIHAICTSPPYGNQYEYSVLFNDFGHTDTAAHFFDQMDFLIPELYRVLEPGRVCAFHVKDRIVHSGLEDYGFQTVYPFSDDCVRAMIKHGFGFLARKTITTDVVRENGQTYRLGWTEQCKDGSKMGCGLPEYLLLFRKPPTDRTNGYADTKVNKDKKEWIKKKGDWQNPEGYSRARWQTDAHGYMRSSGERLLTPEELAGLKHDQIFKLFRDYSLSHIYDFEHHVMLGETLEVQGRLPSNFMLLQPSSWHPDVWSDITRMLTLNGAQYAAGREMHVCPMQFDIVDRFIAQFTQPGEEVLDPFAGIGTVPSRAVKLGRKGRGIELNHQYFLDGVTYCRAAEDERRMPSLFDLDREQVK